MAEVNTDGIVSISPDASKKLKEALDAMLSQERKIKDLKDETKDLLTMLKDKYQLDPKLVKNMFKIHKKGDLNAVVAEQAPMETAKQLYEVVYGLHRLGN